MSQIERQFLSNLKDYCEAQIESFSQLLETVKEMERLNSRPTVDALGLFKVSHDYVEIGGIKWATMNVGAEQETDNGLYFQWGDTQGYTADEVGIKKRFNWNQYKFGRYDNLSKYNQNDGKTILDACDDPVTAAWGDGWRSPTKEEFETLINATIHTFVTNYKGSGVDGMLFVDKTDPTKMLFFPACGDADNGDVYDVGNYGSYWSSSLSSDDVYDAYSLYFDDGRAHWSSSSYRYDGYAVRGVLAHPSNAK